MKKSIKAVILAVSLLMAQPVTTMAEPVPMHLTCYCPESCPSTVTASGTKVREGIMASSRDHLRDCAMVYLTDGTFLGYYEALDIGGTDGIRNGYVIDVWAPSLAKARELMALTEGEVYIEWIEQPQG